MEKIKKLRKILKKEKIDAYLIPKNDEFFGEYVPDHNDRLKYISNFSGSYGFSLIMRNKNYLFVDGRYTLQAYYESGKNFKVITIPNEMPSNLLKKKKLLIGFDPKLHTKKILRKLFMNSKCKLQPIKKNLIDYVWKRKVKKINNKFYDLPLNSVGERFETKINKVASLLKKRKIDYQFITSCENNAWLLNIRGADSKYAPIPNCYILLDKNKNIKLFCELKKIPLFFKKKFKKIKFIDIKYTSKTLFEIKNKKFLVDDNSCSFHFENLISRYNRLLYLPDPIDKYKSIKNRVEIKNIKIAHIYDGIALTKYLFWLKRNFNKEKITELSASRKLYKFRKKNKNFQHLSFPTISGSGPNGAIIHYKATKKTDRKLKEGDIYLVDSGGQYKFGTTDVTRTISLNNSDKRIKNIFTRVLKGHIAVTNFKLKKNTSGSQIDNVARKYLKKIGLDYQHGTGHGVGYFLNVHEGPQAISKSNKISFQEGMVVSNEPGYYEKNKFGIRIENLIYVKKIKNKKIFNCFTMAPIDKNLINPYMLNSIEKEWINNYHNEVFNTLKGYMNKYEKVELKEACSAI